MGKRHGEKEKGEIVCKRETEIKDRVYETERYRKKERQTGRRRERERNRNEIERYLERK